VYGSAVNQNAGFGGTPAGIHNGTDSVLWTGSVEGGPASRFDFDSTDYAYAGTRSVDGTSSTDGVSAVFTTVSPVTVSSYVAFTMYIYLTSWDTSDESRNITITPRLAGVNVGSTISIASRIDRFNLNTWQKVAITFSEFGISTSTIDAIKMTTISPSGTPPDYFVDTLQLEQTGSPLTYRVEPTNGKVLEITGYNIYAVDALDTTLASNSMTKLAYNKILGVTLTNGMAGILRQGEDEHNLGVFNGLGDLMHLLGKPSLSSGYDGTNTWINIHIKIEPILLNASTSDSMQFTISDDLTGLIDFKVVMFGKEYTLGE
jgi:hypothetical protein